MNIYIIIVLFIQAYGRNVKQELPLCKPSDQMLDLTNNCAELPVFAKLECETLINDLQVLRRFEDQFNFINSPQGILTIYNSNSMLFLADCSSVSEFLIPEKISYCTRDLPVLITSKNATDIFFLSKQGILRYESPEIQCTHEYEYFQLKDVTIVRQNKFITTIDQKNREISFYDHSNKTELPFLRRYYNKLLGYYRKYLVKNENFQFFRDSLEIFIFSAFVLILIILIFIKSKTPAKDLKKVIELLVKNFNKKETISGELINVCCENENGNTQKNEIEKEVENLKILKKVSSSIDVISDMACNNPNITKRSEYCFFKDVKTLSEIGVEWCNCKGMCKNNQCSCKKNSKFCIEKCHNGRECLNRCVTATN